jgi:crotonobetainyl-CoA:carnitine CoA-transferase CaiB-like acyl-CoA transferase
MQEEMIAGIGVIIKEKSRAEWIEIFDDTNICFTPALELDEMCEHP